MESTVRTLSILNRHGESETLCLQLFESLNDYLRGHNKSIMYIMEQFANFCWEQGCRDEAEHLRVKVLELNRAIFNLASTLTSQTRWKETASLLLEAFTLHEDEFGEENPHTLKYQEQYQWVLGMMREADGLEKTSSKEYEDKRESTEDQERGWGTFWSSRQSASRRSGEHSESGHRLLRATRSTESTAWNLEIDGIFVSSRRIGWGEMVDTVEFVWMKKGFLWVLFCFILFLHT